VRVSVTTTGRKLSSIRVKRLAAALIRVASGSLFFVFLAATLGLPGGNRSPHPRSALAGSQPARGTGAARPARRLPRGVPRSACLATHAGVSELGSPLEVAECWSGL